MFPSENKPRRRPLVYGKAKISSSTYGVFQVEETPVRNEGDGGSPKKQKILNRPGQVREQVGASDKGAPNTKLSTVFRPALQEQKSDTTRLCVRKGSKSDRQGASGLSTYDVPLSDEEAGPALSESSIRKRRKLTPVKNAINHHTQSLKTRTPTSIPTTTKRRQTEEQHTSKSAGGPKTPQQGTTRRAALTSAHSTPTQSRTPSDHLRSENFPDSPSRLPLTSLKLAATKSSTPKLCGQSFDTFRHINQLQSNSPPPRRRLIDAMTSPQKGLPCPVSDDSDLKSEASLIDAESSIGNSQDLVDDAPSVAEAMNTKVLERNEPSQDSAYHSSTSINVALKSRSTYSRERSYLAEMVQDDLLDPMCYITSAKDGPLGSQNSLSYTGVEEEDEDDQEVAGIRSIHELRQSGSNARSRVDIESLLDDIEAEGASLRARRLHGLTQLVARLGCEDIGSQISEHCIDQRLVRCSLPAGDVVGQTLRTMAFSRLLVSIQLPVASLRKLFQALVCYGVRLLETPGKLAAIVRDRQQNLSRATIKGVSELIGPYCSSSMWSGQTPTALSPQLVLTKCLDLCLRQARQLGDFDMVLPASIFGPLAQVLLHCQGLLAAEHDQGEDGLRLKIGLVVSVMESSTISKAWAEQGCREIAEQLSELGPSLRRLTLSRPRKFDGTASLMLRLILNITNDSSNLCDAFQKPEILSAIFGIVYTDFIQTSGLADVAMEECRLEGVMLALGTLSNLAEHSQLFRQAMLDSEFEGKRMADWLALAFREQVQQASETSSIEQSSSLVAFGYLSVLLCNLCLAPHIRAHVRGFLEGQTLAPLLSFTQEFLGHFRKAEEIESGRRSGPAEHAGQAEEEQVIKGSFVDRFEGVLAMLRQAEAGC